jgi:adenylosuccinate lyase
MIDRYSTPEMKELWSEQAKFQAWLDVELAACEAWTAIGKIPSADMAAIREKAAFTVERIEELDRQLHHDVIAFTTNLAENIGPSSRFVHLGLTSTDVVDTAQSLRLRQAGKLILEELDQLIETLKTLAQDHRNTRSHAPRRSPGIVSVGFAQTMTVTCRERARAVSMRSLCPRCGG